MGKLIELSNVTKTYTTGDITYQALHGISFSIEEGEMVAIIGPSGSGKSTTMHILGALDTPTTGTYLLHGQDVGTLNANELASIRNTEIGFVFQSFNLLPRTTALENVTLPLLYAHVPLHEREVRARDALRSVDMEDKSLNKSNQLSGGQMQRVAIARAIVTNPSIILADEPTGNLDTKTTTDVLAIFKRMHEQRRTIVIITHEPDIARMADRIITLKDGRVISDTKTV